MIFSFAYAISVESHTQWLAARSLLDLANEEGSGSPNRIFPALICIDFKQCGMNGKQSGSDFECEAEEYLRACLGFFYRLGYQAPTTLRQIKVNSPLN